MHADSSHTFSIGLVGAVAGDRERIANLFAPGRAQLAGIGDAEGRNQLIRVASALANTAAMPDKSAGKRSIMPSVWLRAHVSAWPGWGSARSPLRRACA
ncbi:hypothetical protein I551_4450 [Mycobacterium ulcerans str. Harvey]|uniref:Uncharacterized protein n=1 Tax=Mycobacterium ulcerans str. Harvey TaxID=1299332 RepID=A0ABN0QWT7_MYCUL|nr:hypothetical protein I551_4450 [Mycobacterium ulcerans str. Harvey]